MHWLQNHHLGPVSLPCRRRWLHQVKDVIGLGSQATVKEGLVKKTKEKVAVKVYEVRHGAFPLAPCVTLHCAESPAILRNPTGSLARRKCCAKHT